MSQSKAAAIRSIRLVRGVGTFISSLMSSRGDIYQYYQGKPSDNKVSPVYDSANPLKVTLRVFDTAQGQAIDGSDFKSIKWYLGSTDPQDEISFGVDNISAGNSGAHSDWDGVFERGAGFLNVQGNLAIALGGQSSYLFAVAVYDTGTGDQTFTAQMPVTVLKTSDETYRCSIFGDPSLSVTDVDMDIALKVSVFRGTDEIHSGTATPSLTSLGLEARWYLFSGATKPATPATADTISVGQADINSSELVLCEIWQKGTGGDPDRLLCSDTATVYDDTDPIQVIANPSPEDETIYEYGGNTQVVYTPYIAKSDSSALTSITPQKFVCTLIGSAGETMKNTPTDIAPGDSFTVDIQDCGQSCTLTLIIEAII